MQVRTLVDTGLVTVTDYRCDAGPGARPFAEQHQGNSLSYVRRGSFRRAAGVTPRQFRRAARVKSSKILQERSLDVT